MRIVPVLDVQGGQVVRGVGGRRHEYRPIVSRLTASTLPLDVARAFRDRFALDHLYLADLDAIAGAAPALSTYHALQAAGFRLWIDAGVRELERARLLAEADVEGIVIGLETVAGPEVLEEACRRWAERIVFSLDLKEGRPLGNLPGWQTADPWAIAARGAAAGIRHLIVLDLSRVGSGQGTGTEELCRRLARSFPELQVVAGGGVNSAADLRRLEDAGVRAALVASALHDGRISARFDCD